MSLFGAIVIFFIVVSFLHLRRSRKIKRDLGTYMELAAVARPPKVFPPLAYARRKPHYHLRLIHGGRAS